MGRTCGSCLLYHERNPGAIAGECRRYPPAPTGTERERTDHGSQRTTYATGFPFTSVYSWCGEWRSRSGNPRFGEED
jgi:hypothetical protein